MRFLVLGGTGFVGRHIVEVALGAGHEITLFNRGQSHPGLFPGVEERRGDRDAADLASLEAGEWDAVIDVNGYVPRHVREVTSLLEGRVNSYCFISTGSVYRDTSPSVSDEDAPLAELDEAPGEEVTDTTYGPLKVLCEQEADRFAGTTIIIRPGIVAGRYDPSERFTYWVRRIARGGKVIGPPRSDQPLQLVHAEDQARFVVDRLVARTAGVFNTVGPDSPMTFADMIAGCAEAAGTQPEMIWAPGRFLRDHEVTLPLSLPSTGTWDGIFMRANDRAKSLGFANRSIAETAADTLAWDRTRDQDATMQGLLSADREVELVGLI
jgi:2'-hydroxyisoflavone reductase